MPTRTSGQSRAASRSAPKTTSSIPATATSPTLRSPSACATRCPTRRCATLISGAPRSLPPSCPMCSAWSSSRAQSTSSPGCSADFARPYPRLAGPPRTCSGRPVPTSQHAASPGAALPPHLVLELVPVAGGVDIDQVLVGERSLRAMVPPPVPGMTGHRVQVPPVLLDVLTVITLRVREAERPLLQDRVPPVPQRQGQPQPLLDVAEPGQPVLPPPVGPRPGVVVRQVVPRVAVGAVVLPDRALLPLADVRPPPVPVAGLQQPVLQPAEPGDPLAFCAHRHS